MTNLFMFNDKNTLLIGDLKEQHFFGQDLMKSIFF